MKTFFYVYLSGEVATVLSEHASFATQMGEKADPSWLHYIQTLLPGPYGLAQIERRKAT
jgi:hypothetical protein